jgi:hypothetical protein
VQETGSSQPAGIGQFFKVIVEADLGAMTAPILAYLEHCLPSLFLWLRHCVKDWMTAKRKNS